MGPSLVSVLTNVLALSTAVVEAGVVKRQSPPTTLPENWSYEGCYAEGTTGRALRASATTAADMTAAKCIAFCNVRGYTMAGTEYSNECFCGNSIVNGGAPADSGCNMPCGGAPTEACGGPNRLSVYKKAASTGGGTTPSGPSGWGSLGCYSDSVAARILPLGMGVAGGASNMSAAACTDACKAGNYKYAGTEYSAECFCGNTLENGHTKQDEGCDMPCNGKPSEMCGGANRINIYEFGATAPVQTGWVAQGCYTDSVASRTFAVPMGVDGGAGGMTNTKCQTACRAAGYIWAGTEYSGECFCDNQVNAPGAKADDGCDMLCNGDDTQICGGSNRLTAFKYVTGNEPTSTSTTATATSTSATRTNTATATATGLPDGFAYKGCYVDGPGYRIMDHQQGDDTGMTIASCSQKCSSLGYTIAGMEYSVQCFCDDVLRMDAKLATQDSECNMACGGNGAEKCGGPSRLSVWSSQAEVKVIKKPVPKDHVDGGWKYQGCIAEKQGARVFPWQLVNQTGNSPEWCLGQCKKFGYMTGGLQYGNECYCGDLEDVDGAVERPEAECNTACPADPEAICGGGVRISWYKWTGTPLYVWNYPTGPAAGEYKFLVGGPVIPLITQPAINGKVTLLEKKGTGAPNTTGAYEFDPSIGGDIFHAFREMTGIKTDIFCAAGLTLPDKAGRQINIGGWSLDSTFGVRIYTPDGSAGVNGTNDWQENVEVLKLQRGRWYPTAMVMANGSMLVVGGQDGSNGNPVHNMEILPRVGGVIDAPWLRETNPFNLYPYLAVMPSGNIWVGYYNEHRLLDEVTLDTVRTLPKMPAGIANPNGGRTYPYEGTQVLLPQHAPYDQDLEVLICGGALGIPAVGIDNCISIAPDAEDAEWTIERMPSKRVMSCMATLPDGTFLILNGAHNGEAGFGLADSPNLNAVLYDSSKPKHSRMSVMANTTVARMYHSEAVLLDDGRVMVSGSNPQDPGDFPEEYRIEQFLPPYLLDGRIQPELTVPTTHWQWDGTYTFTMTRPNGNGDIRVSLLGSESSTHGNSMGARILFPEVTCGDTSCTVTAPPGPYVAPVGWYRMFVLEGPTPSHAVWIRLGEDLAELGNWPNYPDFQPLPGV